MERRFDHERLVVYNLAQATAARLAQGATSLKRTRPDLADQLLRASTSIVLNIAEGAGEFSPADKARFYRMARRSAGECAAILEMLTLAGSSPEDTEPAEAELRRIAAMLTSLVRKLST